jgi:hypothetical protein
MLRPHLALDPEKSERVLLRLGLVGFTATQEQGIQAVLDSSRPRAVCWEVGAFAEADVWAVEGSRAQLLSDGSVRVASGIPGGRSVRFSLQEIDRPIAFSQPLAPSLLEPACSFDLADAESIRRMLVKCELWLRPMTCQLSLAAQLMELEGQLQSSIYHVCRNGQMLAVVDLRAGVGILPSAAPEDLAGAEWIARPTSARYIPESFTKATLSELMWQYALRTTRDLLPARYRAGPIYYRRAPRLPHRMLKDSHLLLMRELSGGAAQFDELQQLTGMTARPLAHALAALYLVGSITSNPKRGQPERVMRPVRTDSGSVLQSGLHSRPGIDSEGLDPKRWNPADHTVPAPMLRAET